MAELNMRQAAAVLRSRGLGVQSLLALAEDVGWVDIDDDNGERISEEDLEQWLNS